MKRTIFFAVCLVFAISIISCKNNSGDPTGIVVVKKELSFDKLILKLNKDTLKTDVVLMDKDLAININGISGLKEVGGVVFLGCSIQVDDLDGKNILNYKDLYSYYDVSGISPSDIKNKFSMSIGIQAPMAPGKSYIWKSRIWDKKGTGAITTELKFKVQDIQK